MKTFSLTLALSLLALSSPAMAQLFPPTPSDEPFGPVTFQCNCGCLGSVASKEVDLFYDLLLTDVTFEVSIPSPTNTSLADSETYCSNTVNGTACKGYYIGVEGKLNGTLAGCAAGGA
jgi:hypothetical protein